MKSGLDVQRAVLAIVKLTPAGRISQFVGTGFICGKRPMFVTARHVLTNNRLNPGEVWAGVLPTKNGEEKYLRFNKAECSMDFDIAAIACPPEVVTLHGGVSLECSNTRMPCNQDVVALEFSEGRVVPSGDGTLVMMTSSTRKGNIIRYSTMAFMPPNECPVAELSFPAFMGASGAPVLSSSQFCVVGMLLGNVERHLIPAQIETVVENDIPIETVKYFLPMGIALEGEVIAKFLADLGADPVMVDPM